MLVTHAFIISALTFLAAAADTTPAAALPTSVSGAQVTKIANDLFKYLSTKTTDAAYIAAEAAATSAMPSSVLAEIQADPTDYLQNVLTQTTAPDWYSAIPTSALSVLSSAGIEEIAIVSKDVTGPAPTNVAKVAGAALAAGAAALAVL